MKPSNDDRGKTAPILTGLLLLSVLFSFIVGGCGGGSGGGGGGTITPPSTGDDFETTPTQQNNYGPDGEYRVEYFNNAKPAQEQFEEQNFPNVIGGSENYFILDIQQWPDDWDIGKIIAVRQQSGVIEYKRLIMRFELPDSQLAIGVKEASVLEAVDSIELTSNGTVQQTNNTLSYNATRAIQAKALVDYDFNESMTFDIINTSLSLYKDPSNIVSLEFPEVRLSGNANIEFSLTINKPFGVSDLIGKAATLVAKINDAANDAVNDLGEGTLIDDNENALIGISSDSAQLIVDAILTAGEVTEVIESIYSILLDKNRLREGHLSFNGEAEGAIKFAASVSGEFPRTDREISLIPVPIVVPIAGPVPLYLEFELIGEAGMQFDGILSATTGVDVTIPFEYSIDVLNGEIQPMPSIDNHPEPVVVYQPLSLDGSQAGFELTAGLQIECGLTLAKILSASVDPTISMVFETDATLQGNTDAGCVDLDWDLFSRCDVEAEVEFLDIPKELGRITIATLFENEPPISTEPYHFCWGEEINPIDDSDPPSIPIGLSVNATSNDNIVLDWTPSTDELGVAGYKVYRNGVYLKSVTGSGTSDYGLDPSTYYCYTVSAFDAAENESVQCSPGCTTTNSIFVYPNIGREENVVSAGIIPRWSPTSTQIVFIGSSGIWVYDSLNDTSAELHPSGIYPEWSPSGEKICFYNGVHLCVMNSDGTEVVNTGLPAGRDIQWSPDGHYILAGLGTGSPSRGLVLIDAISWTSQNIYFAHHNGEVGEFSWTPSGEILVTVARRSDDDWASNELRIFDLNGTLVRSIFIDGYTQKPYSPSISPNGKYLVFSVGGRGLWLASSDGSNAMKINERGGSVSWSADSNYIAFDDSSSASYINNGIFVVEITPAE